MLLLHCTFTPAKALILGYNPDMYSLEAALPELSGVYGGNNDQQFHLLQPHPHCFWKRLDFQTQ